VSNNVSYTCKIINWIAFENRNELKKDFQRFQNKANSLQVDVVTTKPTQVTNVGSANDADEDADADDEKVAPGVNLI